MTQSGSSVAAHHPYVLAPELRGLLEASPDAVLIVDGAGRIVALNRRVEALFRTTGDRLRGQRVEVLLPERVRRAHAAARSAYAAAPTLRTMSRRAGLTGRRADGTEFPVEVSLTPIVDSADGLVMAVVHDVSARLPVEAALATPGWTTDALDAIGDALFITDGAGRIEFLNRTAEELTGAGRNAARGRLLDDLLPLVSEATGEPVPSPGGACLRHGIAEIREAVLPAAHGHSARTLDLSATPIRDAAGAVTGAAVLARDVTQARRIARQLAHQATHDPLTGLVNRTEFERRLTHVLAGTAGARAQHALCFLDLDGFKRVNDASGHQAGDELLRQLSELMRERMRSRDTLARLGGDEFGVLLEHCRRPQAERVAEQLRTAVAGHRFVVDGRTYTVGASIGVVPIRSGMRPAEAVRLADAACYAAKRSGGDRVFVSDAPLSGPATRHEAKWSQRVLRAIEARRLRLDAQPVIPLGRAAGAPQFELLLRLEETPGAPVMPPSFLPTARRNGLMPILDDWVIREAMRRLGEWSDAHPSWSCPRVAINLSEETVAAGNAPAVIEGALASHGVPPDALCFEVSEATIMAHPAAGMDLFRRLRSLGCRSTIEHCGTGIAAFTHLRRLRPDFLKMAGHIVREVDRDPVQCALATALNQVGHVLGMGTIGFQVERPAALAELRRLGVDYAQGFGIGRPEPLSQALARAG